MELIFSIFAINDLEVLTKLISREDLSSKKNSEKDQFLLVVRLPPLEDEREDPEELEEEEPYEREDELFEPE